MEHLNCFGSFGDAPFQVFVQSLEVFFCTLDRVDVDEGDQHAVGEVSCPATGQDPHQVPGTVAIADFDLLSHQSLSHLSAIVDQAIVIDV